MCTEKPSMQRQALMRREAPRRFQGSSVFNKNVGNLIIIKSVNYFNLIQFLILYRPPRCLGKICGIFAICLGGSLPCSVFFCPCRSGGWMDIVQGRNAAIILILIREKIWNWVVFKIKKNDCCWIIFRNSISTKLIIKRSRQFLCLPDI